MDPRVSATLLGLLNKVPGSESIPQRFPLLFPTVQRSVGVPEQSTKNSTASRVSHGVPEQSATVSENSTVSQVSQVNVISGGILIPAPC